MERCEVRPVELGQSYAVRVRAVNAAGVSNWSLDSDQITVRWVLALQIPDCTVFVSPQSVDFLRCFLKMKSPDS